MELNKHFPSDVIGSIVLGLVVLYLFHAENAERPVARVLAFAQQRAAWFYMAAFVMTFQIATLFDDVREQGYATNYEESEEGVGSVAIALHDQTGRAVAAIAVAVPVSRLGPKVRTHIVRALREAQSDFRSSLA